jgi:hypothetical protein
LFAQRNSFESQFTYMEMEMTIPVKQHLAFTIAFCVVANWAIASQPPDPITSDSNGNTAMGANALLNNCSVANLCTSNTAVGDNALLLNTSGMQNTAVGRAALANNTSSGGNTAIGFSALSDNVAGSLNTAVGMEALLQSQSFAQTAVGFQSLFSNTTGQFNVAIGATALYTNIVGSGNVAVGSSALYANIADNNTGVGYQALTRNISGADNAAFGEEALYANTRGWGNVALGKNALRNNDFGSQNAFGGYSACWLCVDVSNNVGFGFKTLYLNSSGSNNIALGSMAGYNINGSANIDIGNEGAAADSGTIRIGTPGVQTTTVIAGIATTQLTGAPVYVGADGKLGVLASSERYKTAIDTIAAQSEKLSQLRPVTFRLKSDPAGPLQYGLVAEEVAKIYPGLVIRDASGTIQGVRYDELTPILLAELQAQTAKMQAQAAELAEFKADLAAMNLQSKAILATLADARSPDHLPAAHH